LWRVPLRTGFIQKITEIANDSKRIMANAIIILSFVVKKILITGRHIKKEVIDNK
jgi:hypothetical protein